MKTYQVHVFRVLDEMIVKVEADSEREALDDGRTMAEGRPPSAWSKPTVNHVALIYVNPEGEGSD